MQGLKHPFSEQTRSLYMYHWWCMDCGSNVEPSLHHIAGRISDSPLNGIILCGPCHAKVGHTKEEEQKYFGITLRFHVADGYTITERDLEFINSYPRLKELIWQQKPQLEKELVKF